MSLDENRIKKLSEEVKRATSGYVPPKEKYKVPIPGVDYHVPEGETPESIAAKLNSRKGVIDASVIKGLPTPADVVGDVITELKTGKKRLEAKDILNLPATQPFGHGTPKKIDTSDLRWHGAGLAEVTHDSTLSGNGTISSPLSVVTTTQGVNSINGDSTPDQTLAVGTSGTNFAIADNGTGTHTFNLPVASATNTGKLSNTDWSTFNNKVSSQWITSGSDIYYSAGKVGIGTASPTEAQLVVNNTTGTAVEMLSLKSAYNTPSGAKSITWRDQTNILGQIDVSYAAPMTSMSFGHLYNSGYQTGDIMTIRGDGSVGIGTTTPGTKFAVSSNLGNGTINTLQRISGETMSNIAAGGGILTQYGNNSVTWGAIGGYSNGAGGGIGIWKQSAGGITSGAPDFYMNVGGNVGVGTTTPGSSLQVNGGVAVGYSASQAAPTNGLIVNGHVTVEGVTSTGATGTGKFVFDNTPTLATPVLGVATATSINKVAITAPATSATLTIANGKTLTANNSITLAGTDSTTMTFPSTTATIARTDAAQTFVGIQTIPQVLNVPATISVSSNAGTVTRANRINNFTNSSAATMTITMSTTGATDGDMVMVVILDSSAAAQTITWVNTEDSTVAAPTTSNGSTTLPLTVGFKWNAGTSKWRCIAKA